MIQARTVNYADELTGEKLEDRVASMRIENSCSKALPDTAHAALRRAANATRCTLAPSTARSTRTFWRASVSA
jgi:hypothetical protein